MSFLTQSHQVFFGCPLSNSFNFPHFTVSDDRNVQTNTSIKPDMQLQNMYKM